MMKNSGAHIMCYHTSPIMVFSKLFQSIYMKQTMFSSAGTSAMMTYENTLTGKTAAYCTAAALRLQKGHTYRGGVATDDEMDQSSTPLTSSMVLHMSVSLLLSPSSS